MGLFDVFKKKECCICGNEVGLLGNRKLADGNMCSKCTRKLSPWFEDRRESTMEQIKAQLAYREQNAKDLENFTVTSSIGEDDKIYLEEVNGIPIRFFVTGASDYKEENPDIISFKNVVIGITLPFFSYGGSSMVTMYCAMGLISGTKFKPKPQHGSLLY